MKHLRVEYNGIVLFDGQVDEVSWNDSEGGVTVSGKMRRAGGSGGGGLLDLLAGARRQQTQGIVAEKRASMNLEEAREEPVEQF
jgi:hypothetical protein